MQTWDIIKNKYIGAEGISFKEKELKVCKKDKEEDLDVFLDDGYTFQMEKT